MEMQRNWIGRSEGAEIDFSIVSSNESIRVFTTRPDTLFGATYMVLAPEHPIVSIITTVNQRIPVEQYIEDVREKAIWNAPIFQKKKLVFLRVRMPSILQQKNAFQFGLRTMCL